MRRLSLLLATLMLAFAHGWCGSVDAVTAKSRAERFLSSHAAPGRASSPLRLVRTVMNSTLPEVPVYYIFNASNRGFVVVAGDDRAREILAHGDRALDMGNLPENMQFWLDCYQRQLEYLQAHPDIEVSTAPLTAGATDGYRHPASRGLSESPPAGLPQQT